MSGAVPRLPLVLALLALAAAVASAALARPAPALAQEPRFEVQAVLDRPQATLGDHVTLTITVRHERDLVVSATRPAGRGRDIELVSVAPSTTQFDPVGDGASTTFRFVFTAFRLGEVQPGEVEVSWLRDDGTSGSTVVQPPAATIAPVRQAGDAELRPLKPQATVPGAPPSWQRPALIATAAVVALSAAGAGLVFVVRRLRRPVPLTVVDVSPESEARARLDRLSVPRSGLAADYAAFYGAISTTIREYLARRFAFPATALTTTELERRMVAEGVDRWQARLVSGLLGRCDAAVYARSYPDPASADHDLTMAYEIVELSRPQPYLVREEAVTA